MLPRLNEKVHMLPRLNESVHMLLRLDEVVHMLPRLNEAVWSSSSPQMRRPMLFLPVIPVLPSPY